MGSGFLLHLVGSVPMTDAEAVFQACARLLGNRLSRLPDGETGYRSDWLAWQVPVFRSCPQFEVVPADPPDYRPRARVRLPKGVEAGSIQLQRLGYAAAARQSYALFERRRRRFLPLLLNLHRGCQGGLSQWTVPVGWSAGRRLEDRRSRATVPGMGVAQRRSHLKMGEEARRAPRRRHQRPQGARRPGTSDADYSAGTVH